MKNGDFPIKNGDFYVENPMVFPRKMIYSDGWNPGWRRRGVLAGGTVVGICNGGGMGLYIPCTYTYHVYICICIYTYIHKSHPKKIET